MTQCFRLYKLELNDMNNILLNRINIKTMNLIISYQNAKKRKPKNFSFIVAYNLNFIPGL